MFLQAEFKIIPSLKTIFHAKQYFVRFLLKTKLQKTILQNQKFELE